MTGRVLKGDGNRIVYSLSPPNSLTSWRDCGHTLASLRTADAQSTK
jgi:hypothetical protein